MDETDPFAQFLTPEPAAPAPAAQADNTKPADPFAAFLEPEPGSDTDPFSAFAHAFERNIAPAAGGLAAAGAGAEIGGALGLAAGPAAPIASPILAIGGGLVGAIGGSAAVSAAQDWALKALPESWQDFLGQSEQQRAKEETYQPTASFLGGTVPYVLSMKPGGFRSAAKLPPNATAFQRIAANPATGHIFGGALAGGMEAGTEYARGEPVDPTKVAIATGFGLVFNETNRIGARLTEMGAGPARRVLGRPEPETAAPAVPKPETPEPTVAQAMDAKVVGPGATEETFMGTHQQAPDAAMSAQDAARTEAMLSAQPTIPDVVATARRMEPEAFSEYDALLDQRDDLAARLAQVRDPVAEVQPAEAAALQLQINATDRRLRELGPQVAAAHRRAADAIGAEVIEPEVASPAAIPSTVSPEVTNDLGVPSTKPIEQQVAEIAADVAQQLIAAGRPKEEADAAAQLIAHRYRTRAARLGDTISPEALYQAEGASIRRGSAPPVPAAPLMPTIERPNLRAPAPEIPAPAPAEALAPAPAPSVSEPASAQKSDIESLDPSTIGVDAERFQFKGGGDEEGVTERLQDIGKWDPRLAGTALVFRDADGKNWIADGHQRLGLAKRLMEGGHPPIKINAFVLDAKDGITDVDARAIAAVKNIAEGTGTATDAAKVLRAAKDSGIDLPPLPPRSALVRDGRALANLSPEAFGIIVNEVVPTAQGAIVGRMVRVPEQQVEALRLLATLKPDNLQQAEMVVRDMLSSGTTEGRMESLFGTEDFASSIVLERAKIADEAMKQLRKDKQTFKTLVDEAGRIEGAGANVLDQTANQGRLSTDEQASDFLKQLAFRAGPVSDALSDVARKLKSGEIKVGEAARTFLGDVRRAVEAGVVEGRDAGGTEPGTGGPDLEGPTFFQRAKPPLWKEGDMLGEFETERGQEGFGQALVPGVKPLTDAQRLAAAMAKPLKGGEAPPARGHRFLDQGSRGISQQVKAAEDAVTYWKGVGDADKIATAERALAAAKKIDDEARSHNYVIYDDSRVTIRNFEQTKRGLIQLAEGQKPIIKLFKDADASTFIHETGHQWLEELMRDAVHPSASDVLKDDAQTVRDWLGIGDAGEPIKTRQHEKFARAFEQYVREGVAPNAKLARVFAQFRQWLTSIYQTIRGLGAPINEDIRQVFDRMIEVEPNRTVIAPEREGAEGLAAVHETDAATIPAHEAEPAMDRIISERDRYLAEQPPEVQNELLAAEAEQAAAAASTTGPKAGAGAGGEPEVVAGGGEPEAQPTGGAGGGEPGAELSGSRAVGPEGVLARGEGPAAGQNADPGLRGERPGAADPARTQPLAPRPANLIGARESPFTDLAGNIRIENLTSDQDVAQAIRDAAQENNDFIGDRRGVVTDGQVLDLAEALGMDAEQLNKRKIGQAFNAEQVVAARKLLIQSATDVAAAMKRAAVGTDEDVLAYARAKSRHQMIQGQVAGITAEAGRALRAFRSLAGQEAVQGVDQFIRDATGKTLFQLKEEAKLGSLLETPEQVSKFTRDARQRTFGGMILEYWINGLVSGPRTHVTNTIGNMLMSMQVAGPETAAAALIGAVRSATGRQGTRVRLGEVGAQLRAGAASLPTATKAAIDALRTGRSVLLPGEEAKALPYESPNAASVKPAPIDEAATYADIAPDLFGLLRGALDGAVAIGKLVSTGGEQGSPLVHLKFSPLGQIPDIAVRGTTVLPVGTAFRLPTRFLAAGDSFFRAANYSMQKSAMAYRAAADAGLTGSAFDAKVADVYMNPTPEIMEQARGTAAELTFMGHRSEFVKALSRLSNVPLLGMPIFKFVAPFINTPSAIIEQTILHRTPVGLFSPEIRADLMGKNGNIAQDTAMARMLVGSVYAIGFGALAARGLLSGSGPTDDSQRALWRQAGNQAHSARIGDLWYDMRALGPLGMLAGISADLYDVAHAAEEGDIATVSNTLLHAFMQNILDASFMTGPSDLIQALEDPARYGDQYIRGFLSGFVPFSGAMGQAARATDPYSRQARTSIDAVKAKVPGLSQTLWPRRDIWGEEMPAGTSFGPTWLSAIYTTQLSQDPVNIAMLQGGYWPGQPDRKIRGVELTDEQFDLYSMLAGRMAKKNLDRIVTSGQWQQWPPSVKHDVIAETIRQSRETARGMVMMRFPQIIRDATNLKLAKLQ